MLRDDFIMYFKMAHKKHNLFVIIGMICSISLMFLSLSIGVFYKKTFINTYDKIGSSFIKLNICSLNNDREVYFDEKDIFNLRSAELHIKSISPEIYTKGIVSNSINSVNCNIVGGNQDYKEFMFMDTIYGRFFSNYESKNGESVVVIDDVTSKMIFGIENSVGKSVNIKFNGISNLYRVIGIVRNTQVISKGYNNSLNCIVPHRNLINKFKFNDFFEYVYVSIAKNNNIDDVSNNIINFLKSKKNIPGNLYRVERFSKEISKIENIFSYFSSFFSIISLICIILSVISLVFIMAINTNKKINELGILRLLGANKISIFNKLILENFYIFLPSLVLGLIIGIITICFLDIISFSLIIFNLSLILVLLTIINILISYSVIFKGFTMSLIQAIEYE